MAWWLIAIIAYFGINIIIGLVCVRITAGMYWPWKEIVKLFLIMLIAGVPILIFGILTGEIFRRW